MDTYFVGHQLLHLVSRFQFVPVVVLVLLAILLLAQKWWLAFLSKVLGIKGSTIQGEISLRLESPLKLLFLVLACLTVAVPNRTLIGQVPLTCLSAFALGLCLHIGIQCLDLALFSWYTENKKLRIAAVVRFTVLGMSYGLAILLVLNWGFGVSVLPLLATSTILTAVLGLALQDTLKNIFAGLNLSLEKSLREGEWIMIQFAGQENLLGQVVEIGWRTTKIETLDGHCAVIPNVLLTGQQLFNLSRPLPIQACKVTFCVGLDVNHGELVQLLERAIKEVPGALENPPPEITMCGLAIDHANYQGRFWVNSVKESDIVAGKVLETVWTVMRQQAL